MPASCPEKELAFDVTESCASHIGVSISVEPFPCTGLIFSGMREKRLYTQEVLWRETKTRIQDATPLHFVTTSLDVIRGYQAKASRSNRVGKRCELACRNCGCCRKR